MVVAGGRRRAAHRRAAPRRIRTHRIRRPIRPAIRSPHRPARATGSRISFAPSLRRPRRHRRHHRLPAMLNQRLRLAALPPPERLPRIRDSRPATAAIHRCRIIMAVPTRRRRHRMDRCMARRPPMASRRRTAGRPARPLRVG